MITAAELNRMLPDCWFHPDDPRGVDGHQHFYDFKTLQCITCKRRPAPYQFAPIPQLPQPERPHGALLPIERVDLEVKWALRQIAMGHARLYINGMWDEYPETLYEDRVCPSEMIPPGWEHLEDDGYTRFVGYEPSILPTNVTQFRQRA